MSGTKKNRETIGPEKYSPRELSQLVRRRMIQKDHGDKAKYTRKVKHKNKDWDNFIRQLQAFHWGSWSIVSEGISGKKLT